MMNTSDWGQWYYVIYLLPGGISLLLLLTALIGEAHHQQSDANKKLIGARQEIERDKIRLQTEAQVQAFTKVTNAQAEQEAATKESEAKINLAQAEAQARELAARGEKAQRMVAIDISREEVGVAQARVDVERHQLENRQEFADAGIRLEVEKLRIQADKEVQQEFARALASFLSKGNITLYGTPETAQRMMDNMAKGFGIRAMADGFLGGANGASANGNGTHTNGSTPVDALLSNLGKMVGPALEKLTGQAVDGPEQSEAIARALASQPQALAAIAEALVAQAPAPTPKVVPVPAPTPAARPAEVVLAKGPKTEGIRADMPKQEHQP